MSGVTRTCRCPECGLPFFIKFDSELRLGGVLVRVDCPRCEGYIRTHVPDQYQVVAAERRASVHKAPEKGLPV
jgi:hypothetical protein